MKRQLPTEEEIKISIAELFDKVYQNEREWILSCLVPIDNRLTSKGKVITYVVEDEMRELCDFLNSFNELAKKTENAFQKKRNKILNYCHIMEADFPYTVIWNLLRVLNKQKCIWTFYSCDERGNPIQDKNGKFSVLRYSIEKIHAIKNLSKKNSLSIGENLYKLWQSDLRNSFSHSQYFWVGNSFCGSSTISPLSRKDEDIEKSIVYTEQDIEILSNCSSTYLFTFIELFKFAIKPFKDGRVYKIHDGLIRWDENFNWRWAN